MNAGSGGFDPEGDVRQALAAVVRDHGPAILADPRHLGGALNVLLPTAPEETGILVAAARAGTSAQLAEQAAMAGPAPPSRRSPPALPRAAWSILGPAVGLSERSPGPWGSPSPTRPRQRRCWVEWLPGRYRVRSRHRPRRPRSASPRRPPRTRRPRHPQAHRPCRCPRPSLPSFCRRRHRRSHRRLHRRPSRQAPRPPSRGRAHRRRSRGPAPPGHWGRAPLVARSKDRLGPVPGFPPDPHPPDHRPDRARREDRPRGPLPPAPAAGAGARLP
jgi:hypothetical protein